MASARGPARAGDRDRVACGNDRRRRAVLHRGVLRDCGAGELVGDVAGRHTPADRGRDLRAVRAGRARRAAARPTQRTCARARVRRRHRPHRQPAAVALPRRRFGRAGSCLGARAAARDPERGTLHRGRSDRAAARIARWFHAVVDRPGGVVVARRRQRRRARIADGADRDDAADARRLRLGAATGDGPVDVRRDRSRVQQRPLPRPRGTRLSAVDGVQPRLVGPAVAAVRHADGPHPRLECRLAGHRHSDAASRRGDCRRPRGGRVDLQRRRGVGSRRRRGVDDGQRVRGRLAHGGVTPGSAGACGTNGSCGPLRGRMRVDRRRELDTAAVHCAAHRACRDAVGDSRVDVASPMDVRRDRRGGGRLGRRATLGIGPAGRSPRGISSSHSPRGCTRCSSCTRCCWADGRDAIAIRISRRSSRARCASSAHARRSRPAAMAGGSAWCRSRSARCWPSC